MAEVETTEAADTPAFSDADFDSMSSLGPPEGEPAAETPSEGAPPETPQGAQPGQEKPAGEAPPAPPQTFTYRGKVYTPEQIASNPDLMRDLIASAEQLPNQQRAYSELQNKLGQEVERIKQQLAGVRPQGAPGQQGGQRSTTVPGGPGIGHLNPDQVAQAVRPIAEQAAKQGWIEQDMVDLFPKTSSQFMIHRDMLYDVRAAVQEMQKIVFGGQQERLVSDTRAAFNSALDGLGARGEQYAPLKDSPEARQGFEKYLLENFSNLPAAQVLDPKFLERQWWGYNAETIAATLQQQGQHAAAAEVRKRARAVGGGNSGRLVDGGAPGDGSFAPDMLPDGFKFPPSKR